MPWLWRKHYKFAFVRDPFTRFCSCYRMFRWGMEETRWNNVVKSDLTMDRFIEIARDDSIDIWTRKTFEEKLRHHAIPQTHPDNCLNWADFVGRFERLEEDFAKVCADLSFDGKLPHKNNSVTKAREPLIIDEKAAAFIVDYYRKDFEELGYDSDPSRMVGEF